MTTAKYNFNKNLIKASYKKDLYDAKNEWCIIGNESREYQNGLCICQRKVKHIIYMYNLKTNLTIMVGSKCAKKFELTNNSLLNNNILRKILQSNLQKGDYEIIDNIIIYSNKIEEQFKKYFQSKIDNNLINLLALLDIQNELKELINTYSLIYLNNIYETLNIQINKIKAKQEQEIKAKQESDEKAKKEADKIIYQKTLIPIILHECFIDICKCKIPDYELIKANKQYYCNYCNKWKCRCIQSL